MVQYVDGMWYLVRSTWYVAHDACHIAGGTWHVVHTVAARGNALSG